MLKIDHVRMRFVVEPPQADTLALEIGELDYMWLSDKGIKAHFNLEYTTRGLTRTIEYAVHHDNRDYKVLPDFQPKGQSIDQQTTLGPRAGVRSPLFIHCTSRLTLVTC